MYEEEIDLRVYLDVLLRRRRLILVVGIIAAVTAFIVSSLMPPTYEAQAALSVAPRRSNITLTEDFVLSEEEQGQLDAKRHESALIHIAQSLEIAEAVAEARPELREEKMPLDALLNSMEVTTEGDLLVLTASAHDPQRAAALANVWLEATLEKINAVYAFDPATITEIEEQKEISWEEYQKAQNALETFLAESETSELKSQIQVIQSSLQKYEEALAQGAAAPYTEQIAAQRKRLADLYARDNVIEQQLMDARSLQEHLASGEKTEGSWGTELAFINLQASAYGGSLPGLVQWDLTGVAPAVTVPEVERLIASLGAKQAEIREQITALAQQVGSVEPIEMPETSGKTVEEQTQALTEECAALQAQLEAQQAQQTQLTTSRDVAWTAYKSLTNKLLELQVEGTVSTSEARVAFEALPPTERSAPRRLLNTALAGVIGLMLGIFTAFAMSYLQPENVEEALPVAPPAGHSLTGWFLAEASGLPGFSRSDGKKPCVVEVPEEEKTLTN